MKNFPDILGIELQNAVALLEAEGLDFIVLETKSPKRESIEGELRVIRTQIQDIGIGNSDNSELPKKLIPASKRVVITVCRI